MENLLPLLPYLACPVGMGLMMWLTMRGQTGQAARSTTMPADGAVDRMAATTSPANRLAELRSQLGELQAQQATIAAHIGRLSAEGPPPEPRDDAPTLELEDRTSNLQPTTARGSQ